MVLDCIHSEVDTLLQTCGMNADLLGTTVKLINPQGIAGKSKVSFSQGLPQIICSPAVVPDPQTLVSFLVVLREHCTVHTMS